MTPVRDPKQDIYMKNNRICFLGKGPGSISIGFASTFHAFCPVDAPGAQFLKKYPFIRNNL